MTKWEIRRAVIRKVIADLSVLELIDVATDVRDMIDYTADTVELIKQAQKIANQAT